MTSNSTPGHRSQRKESILFFIYFFYYWQYYSCRPESVFSCRNLYTNVHSGFVHNNSKLETPPMSFSGWLVKQRMLYPNHGRRLSTKEERAIGSASGLDDPRGNHAEWSQPSVKAGCCVTPFIRHSWNNVTIEMENRLVVARGQGWAEEWLWL